MRSHGFQTTTRSDPHPFSQFLLPFEIQTPDPNPASEEKSDRPESIRFLREIGVRYLLRERDLGGGNAPPTVPGSGFPAMEGAEEPQCPPGLRKYETMVVLRPDMYEDDRLSFTQKYEELLVADGGMYLEVFNRGVIPLAYGIQKKNKAGETNTYLDGIYLLFTYFTKPDSMSILAQTLLADNDVIRSSSFKIRKNSRFGFAHPQWPGLPVAGVVGYQSQRPPPSSMMNSASSGISVSNSQSEPPSIQNVQNYSPDDDKIVGMKRPYPFSLGCPPLPAPPPSLLPGHFHLRPRSAEEFPSFIRDIGPSNSTPVLGKNPSKDVRVVASPPLSSDNDNGGLTSDQENLDSEHRVGLLSASEEQLEFSFVPTKSQAEQTSRNGNGKKEKDKIDLNLKL